ncbi:MAG: UDP-N-acetylmuramoyl-tripeptide--D-alanyl-D-alanine ligase [Syntrophales bacterium]
MTGKYSPVLRGDEVLKAVSGRLVRGNIGTVFRGISTDSRTAAKDHLFIALIGDRFNGHDFIRDAVSSGVTGVLVRQGEERRLESLHEDVCVISVGDTLQALGDIAHFWRCRHSIPVAAVTGSSGKTTTKEMTAGILAQVMTVLKSEGNFNNLIGLPLTLLGMSDDHDAVILEMGTNRRGEIARLTDISSPDIGLITNIGRAHLEGLHSVETIREEKGDLFQHMGRSGIAVINIDDENLRMLAALGKRRPVTFGIEREALVRAENIKEQGEKGVRFTLKAAKEAREISIPVPGRHNVYNALAAASIAWCMGMEIDLISSGLRDFKPVPGRMEVVRLRNGAFMIRDTYNANPDSVRAALAALAGLKGSGFSAVVLGDMLELGGHSERMHEEVGYYAAETGVDALFLRGNFSEAVASGARAGGLNGGKIFRIEEPHEIASVLESIMKAGDWVLIKGSRRMKMEEVSAALENVIGITESESAK